ncbi:alpha/beta hydrolase [Isoptericola sp. b441]|uniref:Alpha/beta hydrolase n=1 Tax=Actinotalea lenta TaxID=3064654 RepID=A0ABT9D8U0_9CELL|nr:alpha/beta hydrolase [Isoptericola sp. b441]MDO8106553.1 alpha/beta hydrolase [Isoptericola sp. b441]
MPARRHRLAAVVALAALALAGCAAPREQITPVQSAGPSATTSAPSASAPAGGTVESFYGQSVSWSACGDFQCATISAPLNWADPSAGSISLAIERRPADDPAHRIGSLLINPGGPGSSGVDFLSYAVTSVLGADVLADYDVVAFDPRGVGKSSAVECGPDSQVDTYLTQDVTIDSQASLDAARAKATAFGQACQEDTGALLAHVDTASAARDMDLMRALLGDDQLHYLGFSYGTFLGATYAGLFPKNVGRLVLDGALDPSLTSDQLSEQQAQGFENALRSYVQYCQNAPGCPLTGSVSHGMQQIADVVDRAKQRPLSTSDGHAVNGTLAFYGVIVTLYNDDYWPLLTQALSEAINQHTGGQLLEYADVYLDRTADGTYLSNSNLAIQAINCLDYPAASRDYQQMVAFRDQIARTAPTFADWFAMAPGCETWPVQSTRTPAPIHATGAAPILVVGTTGDPATPYRWAQALADQLDSGVLLTWKGQGHTAYGRAGSCISDAVETYLLTGATPPVGTTCS